MRKNRILVSARQAPPPAVVAPASVPVGDARPAYVTSASTGRVAGAATAPTGRDAGPTTASTGRDAGAANRIRVRLANGNEMEAEGGALAQVQSEILEAFFDPAKDGLLVYKLPRQHSAALPALRQRLSEVAAKSKLDYDEILELVTISGTDAVE
jgi:hypothetical protein